MYSVDEALTLILKQFEQLPPESVLLDDTLGRTLAHDIVSEIDLPPFANSSMDGFAVRSADLTTEGVTLTVIGDIPAGSFPKQTVGMGQSLRIMTGAPVPDGADLIIPVEDTNIERMAALPETVRINRWGSPGSNIRPVGEDIRRGEVVLAAGRVLRAADLGLMASLGIFRVEVIKRPLVAILSTGDELVEIDQPLSLGQIRDANRHTLRALIHELGADVLDLGISRDTVKDVETRLLKAVDAGVSLILSSAGVSVGAFDVVKSVVESLGALGFWKVNLRPGKPLAFGHIRSIPYIGLPGNPVSAAVTFDVFVRPALLRLMGRPHGLETIDAICAEPLTSDGRRSYLRVKLEKRNDLWVARLTGTQSSGALSSLVRADGLLIIPDGVTEVPPGTRLQVRRF